ncbi:MULTISPECIES: hypothetical protein [unclassified Novosphingobium]|uniref:hypothetical protein n=1 Tax=unclassified Novosphingobium TaxID=2644732 RepID=UPI00145BCB1F|nr:MULTISPECIES: hypothetical protein [unclassified Novosphingobium]MBB3356236.1 hypothetical protein [Novosphingobium sp. BK256]MBB3372637.1 hypothetical protein [Novosphingobium sp. BK280]MBB3377003.1 hypothetical protein [Novosphingobium sp. BK258]MBB3419584.1 hypothetical protein [Novosphingobium sp. BK267]MBB3448599.1 hypothetical protein [Novosphingobium sp. BK352]
MRPVQYTVRVPIKVDKAIRALAKREEISVYALVQRCVQVGAETLAVPPGSDTSVQEIITELALASTRLGDAERMLERVLFTACAAYGYARAAALGLAESDETITAEINAAHRRQMLLAQERKQ